MPSDLQKGDMRTTITFDEPGISLRLLGRHMLDMDSLLQAIGKEMGQLRRQRYRIIGLELWLKLAQVMQQNVRKQSLI